MHNNIDCRVLAIIIILLLSICLIFCNQKSSRNSRNSRNSKNRKNKCLMCLILFGVILFIIVICMNNKREHFTAPINYKLLLPKRNIPKEHTLLDSVMIPSPIGSNHKLTEDISSNILPSVDGDPNSPRHMFMLAYNKSSPDCCPSTFSTSTGCVCMTEKQKKFIQQ